MGECKIQKFSVSPLHLNERTKHVSTNATEEAGNFTFSIPAYFFKILHDLFFRTKHSPQSRIETNDNRVIGTGNIESDGECEEEQLDPDDLIDLDPAVFGKLTYNLLPAEKEEDAEENPQCTENREIIRKHRARMKRYGIPVNEGGHLSENANLDPKFNSVTFGCETFPEIFLKATLKQIFFERTNLTDLNISWRQPIQRIPTAEELKNAFLRLNCGLLVHVWSQPTHRESVFGMVDLKSIPYGSDNCHQDKVDIYFHFSRDEKRVSVLCLSDYSLSVKCGPGFETKSDTINYPAMKAAFSKVTNSDGYYEVRPEELQQVKEEIRKFSGKKIKKNPVE